MTKGKTVVIGGGLAGLTAALVAAENGQQVTVLTDGTGTLPLSGGVIDVLGFVAKRQKVDNPEAAIRNLPDGHPYKRIGIDWLKDALRWFKDFTAQNGLPYGGEICGQIPVATAVGTIKPTCLAPQSLNGEVLSTAKKIVVVGIAGLKDFYEKLVERNLVKKFPRAEISSVNIDLQMVGKRDITMLDVARRLDEDKAANLFVERLAPFAGAGTVFLTGQILGAGNGTAAKIETALKCPIRETTGLPPAVNGLRLAKIYDRALAAAGVETVRGAKVIASRVANGRVLSVTTRAAARENEYFADKFVLATGGFYSGGIVMNRYNEPQEPIFGLNVEFVPENDDEPTTDIFSDEPQKFALTGIATNEELLPLDAGGKVAAENLFVVGQNLGGYDYCFEHSGNGVALASAYKAAKA